ncbi:MAG: methyltransferase domain-containing protein [Elainella sp. Prado103]|jgi:SAM-dependent methyltransferase|nr:methyltransferase domain-containing protein [Elainella sp. Prado103]
MADAHPSPESTGGSIPSIPSPLSAPTPLYTHNPQQRFSDRADDYAKYRPSYPAAAIDQILQGFGDLSQCVIADIGAGTGISSRLFADRGVQVWAIEPNAAMRAAAVPHERVTYQDGSAEHTALPDRSVDGITCCQAFHWFEPTATLAEFHRILKPGGSVALLWNDRNRQDTFTEAYLHRIRQAVDARYLDRLDRKASDGAALSQHSLFEGYMTFQFSNTHWLDRDGLVGIALSTSFVPKTGAVHERLIQDLRQLFDQWCDRFPDRRVALSYQTNLFMAKAI